MLLPFYIMRYEKRGHEMSEDPQLFQELLNEYEVIRSKLEVEITEAGRSEPVSYTHLDVYKRQPQGRLIEELMKFAGELAKLAEPLE